MAGTEKLSSQIPKPKRPRVKSEDFFEYLKNLGYTPSRQEKAAQYDYLFNNPESCKFLTGVMTNVKLKNVASKSEIEFFNANKRSFLFQEDLAEAVATAKDIETTVAGNDLADSVREEELRQRIQEEKTTVENLRKLNAAIDVSLAEKKKDEAVRNYLPKNVPITTGGLSLTGKLESVNAVLDTLSAKIESLLTKCEESGKSTSPDSLPSFDLLSMIEEEDRLSALCKQFIEQYGNDLILDDGDESQPLLIEEMRQVFQEYSKDTERLKHVLVYEYAKQIELKAELESRTIASSKLASIGNVEHMPQDYYRKWLIETSAMNREIGIKCRNHADSKMKEVRKILSRNCAGEIQSLSDLKDCAKTKTSEMFSFVSTILTCQRARVIISEQMLKINGRRSELLTNELQKCVVHLNHLGQLFKVRDQESLLQYLNTENINQALIAQHLRKFDIPPTVTLFYQSTWDILAKIRAEQNEKLTLKSESTLRVKMGMASLHNNEVAISNIWKSIKDGYLGNNIENEKIRQLEAAQNEMNARLRHYAENKTKITQDVIKRRVALVHELRFAIEKMQKEKEQRDAVKLEKSAA